MGLTPPGYVRIPFIGGPACGNDVLLLVTAVQQTYVVPVQPNRPVSQVEIDVGRALPIEPTHGTATYRLHRGPTGKAQYRYKHLKAM
jgi:hypothetical protein